MLVQKAVGDILLTARAISTYRPEPAAVVELHAHHLDDLNITIFVYIYYKRAYADGLDVFNLVDVVVDGLGAWTGRRLRTSGDRRRAARNDTKKMVVVGRGRLLEERLRGWAGRRRPMLRNGTGKRVGHGGGRLLKRMCCTRKNTKYSHHSRRPRHHCRG